MNRRVATVMVHTSPLDQPGVGDAGGMNGRDFPAQPFVQVADDHRLVVDHEGGAVLQLLASRSEPPAELVEHLRVLLDDEKDMLPRGCEE